MRYQGAFNNSARTSWELRVGSCLDPVSGLASLGDKSVDVSLFDPPYSERVHRRLGCEGRSDGARSRKALSFGHLTGPEADAVAQQMVRVCRRWILIFCDELSFGVWVAAIERAGGEYVRKGTWVKEDAMPQMSGDRPSTGTEEIVIAHAPRTRGRMRWNGGGRSGVFHHCSQERGIPRVHQAQKPQALMRELVELFTNPGEIVCDPYAGSGSTGVACGALGRHFLGWELNPEYAEIARRRLAGERAVPSERQQELF